MDPVIGLPCCHPVILQSLKQRPSTGGHAFPQHCQHLHNPDETSTTSTSCSMRRSRESSTASSRYLSALNGVPVPIHLPHRPSLIVATCTSRATFRHLPKVDDHSMFALSRCVRRSTSMHVFDNSAFNRRLDLQSVPETCSKLFQRYVIARYLPPDKEKHILSSLETRGHR